MLREILSLDHFGVTLGLISMGAFAPLLYPASTLADETTGEKIEGSARDTSKIAKKNWRKTKKKVRDATGNSSVKEDTKDGARNVGDTVEDAAKDVKNKVD